MSNPKKESQIYPLSVSTDIKGGEGPTHTRLFQIANAGFTHVLWCHYSGDQDYLYSPTDTQMISDVFKKTGLSLLDLHAPRGTNFDWTSLNENNRKLGVNLVKNRMYMTAELGGSGVMNHWYAEPLADNPEQASAYWDSTRRTLDDLEKVSRDTGVSLFLENIDTRVDNFPWIQKLLQLYEPNYLGVCYDSGHGNIQGDGLDKLAEVSTRVGSIHLSDNFGYDAQDPHRGDTHRLPFDGTLDWDLLTTLLAQSSYKGVTSLELIMRTYPDLSVEKFLAEAYQRGQQVAQMIESKRIS